MLSTEATGWGVCGTVSRSVARDTQFGGDAESVPAVLCPLQVMTNPRLKTPPLLLLRPIAPLEMDRVNHCPHVDRSENAPFSPKLCPPVASLQGSRLLSPKGTVGLVGHHQARVPLP